MLRQYQQQVAWRSPRRRRGGGGGVVIPDASNLLGYIEGDNFDGINNSTLTNGNPISTVVNLGTLGGTFDQATPVNQPTFSTSAGPGGKPAATFSGDSLVSSLAASSWTVLHDGTGCTVYTVMETNGSATGIVSTKDSSNARGIMHGTNTTFRARFFAGTGTTLTPAPSSVTNALGIGTTFNCFASRFSTTVPNYDGRVNGVSVMTGTASAFGVGAPQGTLTIGAYFGGTAPMTGAIRRVMIYAGYHSDATEAAVIAYMQGLDGVTYPAA